MTILNWPSPLWFKSVIAAESRATLLTIQKLRSRFILAAISFLNTDDSVTFLSFGTSTGRKQALLNDNATVYCMMHNSESGGRWAKRLLRDKCCFDVPISH